jgi:hypothetical protein
MRYIDHWLNSSWRDRVGWRSLTVTAVQSFWLAVAAITFQPANLSAQNGPLQPGEAYLTRFSGVTAAPDAAGSQGFTIDLNGTVGSIIDVRAPREPPLGRHWIDEPQRLPVKAAEVGQVFGVALDDASPPNIYLTSTSAFGLHRTADNRQWLPGMWGPGGPGAIYMLEAANGYRPRVLTTVTLDGRANSGPGLGNIAYDRWNKQLFVTDLETGMIHRVGMDGSDRGRFDHGTQGRPNFFDAQTRKPAGLSPIAFDPMSRARIDDCPQPFDQSPQCWNYAASNRRVWGVAVHGDANGQVRLYYAVWSGPAFGNTMWNSVSEDEKRNTIWSVALGPDGSFAPDVRREFLLPDFFVQPQDIARAGYSHPVSTIAFPACSSQPIMLVAERGGIRNLGLAAENAFATPHESRALRYELDQTGAWRPVGRYDVGFYDRQKDGPPFINANCAGGVTFGPGYTPAGEIDPARPDQFVWISGDSLCSPDDPCNSAPASAPQAATPGIQPASAQAGAEGDDSEVHGIQGMRVDAIAELAPAAAFGQNQNQPGAVVGLNESYLIDADINIDGAGNPIPEELLRNDATRVGDVAIYQLCAAAGPLGRPVAEPVLLLPPLDVDAPPVWAGHPVEISHAQYASHGAALSHYRWGSHYALMSHARWRSHAQFWSHNLVLSGWHNRFRSHWPYMSHGRWRSHAVPFSHNLVISRGHREFLSPHNVVISRGHRPFLSPHNVVISRGHRLPLSPHNVVISRGHRLPLSPHNVVISRGHRLPLSPGVHRPPLSPHSVLLSRGHRLPLSPGVHRPPLSPHSVLLSRGHRLPLSPGVHRPPLSPHSVLLSRGHRPGHSVLLSRAHRLPPTVKKPPTFRPPKVSHPPQIVRPQTIRPRVPQLRRPPS